jgi:hypothetical protein
MDYKGVTFEPGFHLTSTGSGGGTLSVTEAVERLRTTDRRPKYVNPAVVARISREMKCSVERAEGLFDDMIMFLWMASTTSEVRVPTPAIDEAWHVFLLFTKDYMSFCDQYCGGYMHHQPHLGKPTDITLELVAPTIDHMAEAFGGPPSRNWDYVSLPAWQAAA